MAELATAKEVADGIQGDARPMAGMTFMAGWPTAYVREKLGVELRRQYMPLIEEPIPAHLNELAQRLSF
jgi:hypothetical protein